MTEHVGYEAHGAAGTFDEKYPASIALWNHASSEFVLLLDYDAEIRRVTCNTNGAPVVSVSAP